jgi:hypothetical protein
MTIKARSVLADTMLLGVDTPAAIYILSILLLRPMLLIWMFITSMLLLSLIDTFDSIDEGIEG